MEKNNKKALLFSASAILGNRAVNAAANDSVETSQDESIVDNINNTYNIEAENVDDDPIVADNADRPDITIKITINNTATQAVDDNVVDVVNPLPDSPIEVQAVDDNVVDVVNSLPPPGYEDDNLGIIDDTMCVYGPPPGYEDDNLEIIDDTMCVYGPPPGY